MNSSRGQKRGNSDNLPQSASKTLKTTSKNNFRDQFDNIERYRDYYDDLYNAFIRKPTDLNKQIALLKYYKKAIAQYKKLLINCTDKSTATEILKNDISYSIATCCNYIINILSNSFKKKSSPQKIEAVSKEGNAFLTEMKSHFSQLTENYKIQHHLEEDITSQISIAEELVDYIESHISKKTSVPVIVEESKPEPAAVIVEEFKSKPVSVIAKKSSPNRDEEYYALSAATLPELLTAEEKLTERMKVIAIPAQDICPPENKREHLNQSLDSFLPQNIQNNLKQIRRSYSAEKICPSLFFQNQTKLQYKIITALSKEMRNKTRNTEEKSFIEELYKQFTMLAYERESPLKDKSIQLSPQLLTWLVTSPNGDKKPENATKKENKQHAKNRKNPAGPSP